MPDRAPELIPFMRYHDAPGAIRWLATAFGFVEQMVVQGADGTIAHAELALGARVVMLGSMRDDDLKLASPRDLGAVTGGIYVALDDIDAHYVQAKAAGAEILRALADTDHGSREYSARDLEGHLWSFGTYRPGLPAARPA